MGGRKGAVEVEWGLSPGSVSSLALLAAPLCASGRRSCPSLYLQQQAWIASTQSFTFPRIPLPAASHRLCGHFWTLGRLRSQLTVSGQGPGC